MGKDDFGENFEKYVPNLMMLLSILHSSHWYGGCMFKSEMYVLYAREEYEMMSRANLRSVFRVDVQQ